ncbi:MAG: ATP-binding protein [Bacteroidota bacterium]|nr:ATP-binding protein [Bacteroidota bacterium]MDE2833675.1 ATP-binding protein [Bacteroidota bacterium]
MNLTPLRWHRLSFRLAWRVSGLMLVLLVLVALAGYRLPLWVMGGISMLSGVMIYGLVYNLAALRLTQVRNTLDAIDRGAFDSLPDKGGRAVDEVDNLLQQSLHTAASIRSQMEERERIEHYRREFLGNVTHELKTPIFSIHGFAETLLTGALKDKSVRKSFVKRIRRNARRLENLAEDLSVVARIEMGELAMNPSAFSLHDLALEVMQTFEPLATRRQVDLHQTIAEGLPPVQADRDRIGQVLSNLVDNAIKYSRENGQVEISARLLPGGRMEVSVIDNGIGIPEQLIPRLTERFFRVDTSRSRARGGTGLGLAIVKHILGAHESTLVIRSQEGSGSTFGFTLPTSAGSS